MGMIMTFKMILLESHMRVTRLILALASLTWAFFLLLPGKLFVRSHYEFMQVIAPEEVWGLLFLTHGVVALWTLKTGTRTKATLYFDGFLGCILWTSSTIAGFAVYWPGGFSLNAMLSYQPPASLSGELWVAIASWWHLIRYWAEEERDHYARSSDGGRGYK